MGPEAPPPIRTERAPPNPFSAVPTRWLGRLTLAVGTTRPSRQETVLSENGYGSARYLIALEAGAHLSKRVVLAGFVLTSGRDDSSVYGGPDLKEESYAAGLALPLVTELPFSNAVMLSPRVGYGFGAQSFYGKPEFTGGPGFGLELALLLFRAHIGVGLGFWTLRIPGQGVAGTNDYGSSYFMVNGVVGG